MGIPDFIIERFGGHGPLPYQMSVVVRFTEMAWPSHAPEWCFGHQRTAKAVVRGHPCRKSFS
jgi:hypothetical protein